ncbi:hypothetical protein [Thauera sp.]|uniref:TubC N-terminal docking domain-related protein n=1 Tax=Thauera sp. TaxID=1905334 RepID=UPI002B940124|nr:hypothetical protein [Thauera sp.]HRO34595.1 hypothetical protein [Thauera sp.]
MNLSELLNMGIIASVGGDGGLQLDAPKGALTPDLIERIRHHKPSLIAEIQAAREVGELGELRFLCRNPAGEELTYADDVHRETPTNTAPPIRATRWLVHFLDREPVEVHFAPAADHAEALAAYRDAVAAEPLAEVRTTPVRIEVRTETAARGCSTCRHRRRPGLSAGYCGGGRDDLPGAYGLHHPLRKLPADEGESCASYLPHEG